MLDGGRHQSRFRAVWRVGVQLPRNARYVGNFAQRSAGEMRPTDSPLTGGTLANLTAILSARNRHFCGVWDQGFRGVATQGIPAIVTSADAHYSVARAAGVMGLGAKNVLKVSVDEKRRMDPVKLEETLLRAARDGFEVFCVVASSGSTPVGAFDPLEKIADVTSRFRVWLHVDGAHGASVLFSPEHSSKVKGIPRADSVTWDAHKMLYTCGACYFFSSFVKKEASYQGFSQDAPYLFDVEALVPPSLDTGLRTLECTRRAIALSLWGTWAVFGSTLFADLIETTFASTRLFYDILRKEPDFEVFHEPESNILCFRYVPAELRDQERGESLLLHTKAATPNRGEGKLLHYPHEVGGEGRPSGHPHEPIHGADPISRGSSRNGFRNASS